MKVYVITYESCAGTMVEAVCKTEIKAKEKIKSMVDDFGDDSDEHYYISEKEVED